MIAVGSGTDAIFLSLKALGIGEGDEVITTSFTFYATIGAIVTTGAKPVYVDIGNDLNIDPDKIQSKITKKTKAILIVHWTGNICKMKQIKKIVKDNKLYLVEDAYILFVQSKIIYMLAILVILVALACTPLKI